MGERVAPPRHIQEAAIRGPVYKPDDIKLLREYLRWSPAALAYATNGVERPNDTKKYKVDVETVQAWEDGREQMPAPLCQLLGLTVLNFDLDDPSVREARRGALRLVEKPAQPERHPKP